MSGAPKPFPRSRRSPRRIREGLRQEGVSWALRSIGGKKSLALCAAARALAGRLAATPDKSAKWVGRDAQRAFPKAAA